MFTFVQGRKIEATSTFYQVEHLWKAFFAAMSAVLCFEGLASMEAVHRMPHTHFSERSTLSFGRTYFTFLLLGAVQGADSRADAFLARLITMGDYGYFCSQMALGGGALKVSGEDLRALSGNSRGP